VANARFGVLPCRGFARAGLRWCGGWRRITSEGPMTKFKSKSKSKASTRAAARTTSESKRRSRSAHSSPKTSTRPDTRHVRILAMLRTPAGATIAAIMTVTKLSGPRRAHGLTSLPRPRCYNHSSGKPAMQRHPIWAEDRSNVSSLHRISRKCARGRWRSGHGAWCAPLGITRARCG
jgi:hypothetical protein